MAELNRAKWMEALEKNRSLKDLSIPGTHDSGSEKISPGPAHCQNFSILRQLNDGIRFLDIRLRIKDDNQLELVHGSFSCGVFFDQVLAWCGGFLAENPGEVILMSVKREEGKEISDRFRSYISGSTCPFYRKDNVPTLEQARGKVVLFKRFPFADFGVDWNHWPDNQCFTFQSGSDSFVIDDCYKLYNTNDKLSEVRKTISEATAPGNTQKFYVTFCSIAYGSPFTHPHTPYQNAWGGNGVNPPVNTEVHEFIQKTGPDKRVGIVILDFYNDHGKNYELVDSIIHTNHFPR